MKRIFTLSFLLLSISIIVTSCSSSKIAINEGNYDTAFERSLQTLQRNKKNSKQIVILEAAFAKAQQQDSRHIQLLKKEGDPAKHHKIYRTYVDMVQRQQAVESLLPLYIKKEDRTANFEFGDYYEEMVHYKKQSAAFLYASAEQLLRTDSKENARRAYDQLKEVQHLFSSYKNVTNLLQEAEFKGTNFVLFGVDNKSQMAIPRDIIQQIETLGIRHLNDRWTEFHTIEKSRIQYDYLVEFELNAFQKSPEHIREKQYTLEKEIEDGFRYKRGKQGNILMDSLGRKIKIPKYSVVHADIIEFQQFKSVMLHGMVSFKDLKYNEILYTHPIKSEAIYDYTFATMRGDDRALNHETRKLLDHRPEVFPRDEVLMLQALNQVKPAIFDIVQENEQLVMN